MRKRNSKIALAIVALVLVLGIGYAVVSSVTLTINGTATAANATLNVGFNGVVTNDTSKAPGATATGSNTGTTTAGVNTATISVSDLANVGDSVTVTYTIQNYETDLDASVYVSNIANDKSDYFTVTTDRTGSENATTVAKNNGTDTVTVTVTLKARPTVEADNTANIEVTLTADPVK